MEGWRNYVARFSSLLVTGAILCACNAPIVTPTQSEVVTGSVAEVIEMPLETEEPTLKSTVTATPSLTPTPSKPDVVSYSDVFDACNGAEKVNLQPGFTFGQLVAVADECYGNIAPDVDTQEGVLSHLMRYNLFDGVTMPDEDTIIEKHMDLYMEKSPEILELLGVVLTPTATPTNPALEISPADFSFPVTFLGPYSVDHVIRYSPCYHWEPEKYDFTLVNSTNWYNFFHAGDMYILNTKNSTERFVILSPVSGVITDIFSIGPGELALEIESEYLYQGKRVYVGIAHITNLFPGDNLNPSVSLGSAINQGGPIAIQETVFQLFRPEQNLDIEIRTGRGGNYPLENDWKPEIFLDPFPFLQDDLEVLEGKVIFDYNRPHCLKSGNFP